MQRTSRTLCLTTLFFAAGAALFFTKAAVIPYKVAYPVLLLSLSLFYLRLKPLIPVGAALLLSAVGDAAGAGGMFIPQMLFSLWRTEPTCATSCRRRNLRPGLLSGRF